MPVYEMLWDCPYCGTRKLLGKTHRFCPGCGAPQDASRRYFPAEADKVAVEDHVYVGADRRCGACQSAMSARAQHCTQCGAPMEGAAEVARVADGAGGQPVPGAQPRASGADSAAAPPLFGASTLFGSQAASDAEAESAATASGAPDPRAGQRPPARAGRRTLGCCLGAAAVAVGLVALATALLWTRNVTATVTGHSWQRSIAIERFDAVRDSDWCDQMPSGAYGVSRSQKQRDTRQVADGEDCTTVRVDQGDGTFREDEQCTTRYREEPVYDAYCSYTVDRWSVVRTAQAAGDGLAPGPAWPQLQLARRGSCRGCERDGKREQKYVVALRTEDGNVGECELPEDRWRAMPAGSRWRVKQGALLKFVSCRDLQPVR